MMVMMVFVFFSGGESKIFMCPECPECSEWSGGGQEVVIPSPACGMRKF